MYIDIFIRSRKRKLAAGPASAARISSLVSLGLPTFAPRAFAFAIPDFTRARIICNSSSENTPAICRNAADMASSSPLRQSMVTLPTIISRRCLLRITSMISHSCLVLLLKRLTSSVMTVSPSCTVSSSI